MRGTLPLPRSEVDFRILSWWSLWSAVTSTTLWAQPKKRGEPSSMYVNDGVMMDNASCSRRPIFSYWLINWCAQFFDEWIMWHREQDCGNQATCHSVRRRSKCAHKSSCCTFWRKYPPPFLTTSCWIMGSHKLSTCQDSSKALQMSQKHYFVRIMASRSLFATVH